MKELGNAFSFPFRDPSWVSKFLIAALFLILCLVGIGLFFIVGYLLQVTQRVMRREEYPMPSWGGLAEKFVLGVKFCLVYVVFILPVIALMLPLIVLSAGAEMSGHGDVVNLVFIIYLFGFMLLTVPYGLALAVLLPIIAYRLAMAGRMSDALDVGAILRTFKADWQNTTIVALIVVGVQSFAAVGIIILFVGVLFTVFYSYLVSAYLHGALYLEQVRKEGMHAAVVE
jgi:hypothetical protein